MQRRDRVVAEHAILGDQDRGQSLGVLEEQAVVPDAQAEHDVEFATVRSEQLGLGDGVAQRLELARPDLFVIGDPEFLLRDAAVLACHRDDFEAVAFENAAQDQRWVAEAESIRETDHPITRAPG